jgi:hypothetical protein
MAASPVNWILLAISFLLVIPACALCWRTFAATDQLTGDLYRQANYEVCGFLFFFIMNLLAVTYLHQGKNIYVIRTLAIGILLYVTVFGIYTNFTNLDNLRIVDMNQQTKDYYFPYGRNGITSQTPLGRAHQRKFLGGLCLGYLSLFFGLISTITNFRFTNAKSGAANTFWVLGLLLIIPGLVVCWTNSSAATYPITYNGNVQSINPTLLQAENYLFMITTFAIVQAVVLTLGLFTAADDLLASSAFIFGVGNLFAPVYYFYIQYLDPSDSEFLWAGPILCWIGCFLLAVSAILAQSTQKEAQV